MPEIHSKTIQPSGAHRHLKCTNALRLEADFPDLPSEAADVGTAGHALAEHLINAKLGKHTKRPESEFVDSQVEKAVGRYVSYISEVIDDDLAESPEATFFVERRVDLSDYVKGCFGTADFVSLKPGRVHVCDLKLGFTEVSAEENYQLMIYGLGILETAEFLFDEIETVELTIIQPRINNFSTWEIEVSELKKWGQDVFIPKAEEALSGDGSFAPGEDTCRFCKAKHKCRARADYFAKVAEHDFTEPELMSDEEIGGILLKSADLKKWLDDIFTYAQTEALTHHKKWTGFKVIRSTSRRKYSDDKAVVEALKKAGIKDATREIPITITDMEDLLGEKKFKEILGKLVIKPEGKLKLAAESEKGEPVDLDTATKDFTDNTDDESTSKKEEN